MQATDDPRRATQDDLASVGDTPVLAEPVLADIRANDNGDPEFAAWLTWLSSLLAQTRLLALVSLDQRGKLIAITQVPDNRRLPGTALRLVRRAAQQARRQRVEYPGKDQLLLALPVIKKNPLAVSSASTSKGSADAVSGKKTQPVSQVLLLVSARQTTTQQSALLGLVDWALKSLEWVQAAGCARQSEAVSRELCNTQPMREARDVQQLLIQLSARFSGAQCALLRLKKKRGVNHKSKMLERTAAGEKHSGEPRSRQSCQYKARVVAMAGQERIDTSSVTVRNLARLVEQVYGEVTGELVSVNSRSEPILSSRGLSDGDAQRTHQGTYLLPIQVAGATYVLSLTALQDSFMTLVLSDAFNAELVPALQCALLQRELQVPLAQSLARRLAQSYRQRLNNPVRRVMIGGAVTLLLLYLLYPVEKRVSAQVLVEAAERHVLIAPLDGYVNSVHARAGDRVAQGDLLATLDDKDLLRSADKWLAEQQKIEQEYLSALALRDRVEMSALRERRSLINTELAQVRAQIERHALRAPVSGIVLSDSVQDALGSAVKSGDVLFEVGSAEEHRLALQVPERSINRIATGQELSLRMRASPKENRRAVVDLIVPIAVASQGENTFKVYASPADQGSMLRPGMKGIGKILVGRESRLQQWAYSLWSRCVWLAWKLGLTS